MNRFLLCLIYSNNFNNNKLNNLNYVIAKYRFRLKKNKIQYLPYFIPIMIIFSYELY